jgi:hypothetical protein
MSLDTYRAYFASHEIDGRQAKASHESSARVPLNAIIGFADGVKESGPLNEQQLHFLKEIHNVAKFLLQQQ